MGANRTTFEKLQRDRAKKAKAAAKRARRHGNPPPSTENNRPAAPDATTADWQAGDADRPLSAAELLTLVEQLQTQYETKLISAEEFEERKADLLARVSG